MFHTSRVPAAAPRLAGLALALVAAAGCVSINVAPGARKPLTETVVLGERGPKILLIEIEGVISEEPETSGLLAARRPSMTARVREELDRARDDSEVKALLLRINSPGGTTTASDIIYRELLRFKEERGVPVVAQLMGVATSGGYYVAMAADRIHAHPTTVTGSIGVIFLGLDLSGLMRKIGVADQTLTSGEYKDAGSWLRPMKAEERAQLQSILDDLHDRFRAVVAEGRPDLDAERIASVSDGRIFSAAQAESSGLVDALGDLNDSVAVAEELAGLEESRLIVYHRTNEWRQNYYARGGMPPEVTLRVATPLDALPRPGFLYLWAPGAH